MIATPFPKAGASPGSVESVATEPSFSSELYVDATFPVTMAFAPNGDLFYNELCGKVRIVTAAGALLPTPFVDISSDVACQSDFGMTGLALDPQFDANGYVYIFYMHEVSDPPLVARPTLVRYTNINNVGVDPTIILGDLPLNTPGQKIHGAANIHFGPDDQLYVSLGDLERYDPAAAQDLSTPEGKLLRIDSSDGSASPGNPFIGQPAVDERIYAYGLRNSFDFTFGGGRIYATENGPTRCDELNIINFGGNYGWPLPYTGDGSDPWDTSTEVEVTSCIVPPAGDTEQAIYWFRFFTWMDPWNHNSPSAPTGIVYIDGDDYAALGDSLLVCEFKSSALRLLPITGGGEGVIDSLPILGGVDGATEEERAESCRLGLAIAPNGEIYYSNLSEIRKLVIEGDSDFDGVPDGTDNCPNWHNPTQVLPPWPIPADDPDCDGFDTITETFLGTDPLMRCAADSTSNNEPTPDEWPVDHTDDQIVNLFDVVPYIAALNSSAPGPPYAARLDLDMSGDINLFDVIPYVPVLNETCSP